MLNLSAFPQKSCTRGRFSQYIKSGAVKLKPNISRNKYLSICEYGALPHCPTKGLSARPLETFGRKYFVLFLKYRCC